MVLWELIVALSDFLIGCVGLVSLEWGDSKKESIDYDTQGPDIDLKMIALSLENLWGNVIGSATDRPFKLSGKLEFASESKIPDFDLKLWI